MYEHKGDLKMYTEHIAHMRNVITAVSSFLEKNPDTAIWSISSSHNNVIRIRCEGEELLTDFLTDIGFTIKTVYLMLEIYPKTGD